MSEAFPLPEAYVARMRRQLGEDAEAFLQSYEEPALRGIRLNPWRRVRAEEAPGIGEMIPWAENAWELDLTSEAGALSAHEAGAYYIQEPSAMLPAAVLAAQPGEKVLDLCAAPGGKTTQLAAQMAGDGLLVCNEPVGKRAQILSRNVERMGIPNALVVSALPEQLAAAWPEGFDAVLVDAPCSGEGMFRRHPETRLAWSEEMAAGCAKRQADILQEAAKMVRPGGRLVYSTCTFHPAENEDNVHAFLRSHPDFELVPFSLPGAKAPEGMLTCYPHRMRGEGQFVALLHRKGEAEASLPACGSLASPPKEALRLLQAFDRNAPVPNLLFGNTLCLLPDCPEIKGIRVLRVGLQLGEAKNGRFLPDHAWALAKNAPNLPRIEINETQARQYLAGEALRMDSAPDCPDGYVLPTLNGLALGWAKKTAETLKNHYPKGLRKQM